MGEFGKQASVIIKTVRSSINVLDFYVQYNQNYKANSNVVTRTRFGTGLPAGMAPIAGCGPDRVHSQTRRPSYEKKGEVTTHYKNINNEN